MSPQQAGTLLKEERCFYFYFLVCHIMVLFSFFFSFFFLLTSVRRFISIFLGYHMYLDTFWGEINRLLVCIHCNT
ncbi:hypothetical protein GE21DRAFT_1039862 [Neurospora crassa]|nr:hypothetical protein GE21DRAFT_1039862 [Neurospora crassa]